ncbi:Lovastatin nonaketide synthase [Pyrenophora tritici-repentis]|uniref:Lovastatin nonaketide synthase n=1 Tax=Pyrenophora tritici-repentis TaxID=45151 RepID=A0A922N0G2_9PLEO|nr:Lovastatin nonaketide synthase [Pyrenophora tritici-repentis]KAI1507606.1 Lovastatin nonaketide synthase [Pyrenophora tritici-repentis]KAI1676437.1 Lovastatin nonaketide synthase [Pyrenophora tritici-repentis]KAI1678093.1 Lovastatin nonaketide synthase [Pyrenophora tritici-repentis]
MASPRGELLVRIGENIIPIFKKEVNPLELMFGETNLMPRTYDQGFPGSIKPLLAKYLEALSFNRPNLRIMEVGAGTGSATEVILEVLGSRTTADLASIGRYHFTDLSGGFLERARKRFSKWSSLMEYDILDIERDPAAQGFQAESYDVVVATHVLHATADLQRTLANVRSLLKPGGKLLLIENMQPDLRCTPFAFGVLPGWWTSIEPDRALNPLIREDRWNEILGKSGFTSTNLILRDTEDNSAHEISVVVSTAMKSEFDAKTCGFESILAVCGSDTQLNSELVVSLVQRFHQHSVELQTCNYHNLRNMDLRNTLALVLLDLNSFDISNLTEALIWVSGDEQYNPKLSMPTGVIRTIRWERDLENINFSILRFRNPLPDIHLLSDKIVEFYCHNFDPRLGLERNGEFMFQNDSFWTNRLLHSKRVNDFLSTRFTQETHLQPLGHGLERPLKSMIRRPRQSASLEFIEDESQLLPVKPTEVKILVQACGLSSRDIMTVNGDAPGDSLGGQASGIITEVGVAVTSLKVGERVMFINPSSQNGTLQSTFRTPAGFVQKIPDDVDHVEAAAVPIAFCAAFHALHNIAKLAPKEKLLIHSAASSVGQAAIQLASLIGADIFATVSTTQMRELLINEYGVKEDHIFFSRDVLFEKGIMEITKGRGIDDSLFANMTYAQFNAAIKPKVQGSLNLIEALPRSIDFFICLSSAAAVVGNRGQANYVAANTFQDALAEHLVLTGLPGLSINLGSVLTVGWVAENQQNLPISAAFGTLSEEELLSVIEYHIDPRMKAAASVDTCHTVAGLRSSAYFVQRGLPPPAFMQFPFFSHLLPSAGVHNTDGEKEIDFPINDLLKTADSLQTAGDAVSKAIGWKLSRVMSIPTEDIDLDRSLTSYGVDSLVTVDFRTWIMKDMAAIVQASDILSEKSMLQLGTEIAKLSSLVPKE